MVYTAVRATPSKNFLDKRWLELEIVSRICQRFVSMTIFLGGTSIRAVYNGSTFLNKSQEVVIMVFYGIVTVKYLYDFGMLGLNNIGKVNIYS